MGVASLVLGIIALVLSVLFFPLGIICGIVAIVLGGLGRARARRGEATNGGQALAGLIMGIVGLVVGVIFAVTVGVFFSRNIDEIRDCSQLPTQQEVERCLEERLVKE